MIYISKPYIKNKDGKSYLISNIKDEKRNINEDLWFCVDENYGQYLCDDLADSFLLGLLPIAVKTEQDICVEGAVSQKLLYNIQNGLEPAYQKIFNQKGKVCITADEVKRVSYNTTAVATGCSLGVDSLSSIFLHLDDTKLVPGFKLTHLTLFNSGQLGDYDLEASEKNFLDTVQEIQPFAKKIGLPVLAVNGNLNFFYKESGIIVLQSVEPRTIAFALAVQKLIKSYILASAFPVDKIKFDTFDTAHQQAALLPLMETESFSTYLADQYTTRVEKTAYIIKKPYVPEVLKVCWAEQTAFEVWHNTSFLEEKTKVNCGWCDKCLRTLLAIEVLQNGDLHAYEKQFELKKYYEYRNAFIRKVFKQHKKNVFYEELLNLILDKKYKTLPAGVLESYKAKCKIREFLLFCKKVFGALIRPKRIVKKILKRQR